MGAELLQRWIVELFRPLVERWLAERGVRALTGADQFIYFRRGDVRGRVPPDVFVLPGVRPDRRMRACASRPGASGDVLFPTEAEQERAARELAEAEVKKLRAQLERAAARARRR